MNTNNGSRHVLGSESTLEYSDVQNYYGEVLTSSRDLKTNACCSPDSLSREAKDALTLVHPEVIERFYGCGSPIPPLLSGLRVLDLGCGTGRDSYLLSKLVGESGSVIGVDMTEAQLAVARRHVDYHTETFGYSRPNIEFRIGTIEDLQTLGIEDESIDLVVSNCVLNLSPNKERVFQEIFRVLRQGGELYFADIFADRRIPNSLAADPVLRGECLGGALYVEDFRRLLINIGSPDYRVVSTRPLQIGNRELEEKIGMVGFTSDTIRAFKVPLEDRCEDYGQVAFYLGTIAGMPHGFSLDDHHHFETNRPMLVCGNTAEMLSGSRYSSHFRIEGDKRTHFGLFECKPSRVVGGESTSSNMGNCC